MTDYFKNAIFSIWSNKIRSLLTVLGVVIGVSSVTILISLGQGLKKDVSSIIQGLGTNVIAVISGKIDMSSKSQSNPAQLLASDILTMNDVNQIALTDGVEAVTPMSMVAVPLKYKDKIAGPTIVGTYSNVLSIIDFFKLEKGQNFENNADKKIVISKNIEEALFSGQDAIGQKVMLGTDEFEIIGVLKKPTSSIMGSEYDNMALISYATAKVMNKNQDKIYRIIAKAKDNAEVKVVKENIYRTMLKNHNNQEDFTAMTQDDILDVFSKFLNLATVMISAIASISLIVGGIGIMNIMLVTVTERTKEIGLRKAVGATRGAILMQFLIEAIIVTLLGGLIGLAISFAVGLIIAAKTPLTPDITLNVVLLAVGISTFIGLVFGLWPALRAASKDPIEALRYE